MDRTEAMEIAVILYECARQFDEMCEQLELYTELALHCRHDVDEADQLAILKDQEKAAKYRKELVPRLIQGAQEYGMSGR